MKKDPILTDRRIEPNAALPGARGAPACNFAIRFVTDFFGSKRKAIPSVTTPEPKPYARASHLPLGFLVQFEIDDVRQSIGLPADLRVNHRQIPLSPIPDVPSAKEQRECGSRHDSDSRNDLPEITVQGFLLSLNRARGDRGAVRGEAAPHVYLEFSTGAEEAA